MNTKPTQRDAEDRSAIDAVAEAVKTLNDALRAALARKIRVEFGTVSRAGGGYNDPIKVASDWRELWTKDGLAVRFTREEIAVAPEPEPPVTDGAPGIQP
jgi:hypothetical protein